MNIIKNLSLAFLSIFLTLIILEFFLRIVGHVPFDYRNTNSPYPSIYQQDHITGWSNKEGSFVVKMDEGNIVKYNILKDGSRYSGYSPSNKTPKNKIILIGGSFTLGQAINDDETFAYNMQKKLKNYEIKNYGSGGFGTYQSYLKLKQIYNKFNDIDYVLYFFVDLHEARNIGDASWLEFLSKLAREPVKVPYAKLDNSKELVEYPPLRYIVIPFSNHSVLISKIQKKLIRLKLFSKQDEKKIITKKIILKINELSKSKDSNFIMINLLSSASNINDYKKFALENGIKFINCQVELNDQRTVKNEGHPNGLANKKYSNCILKNVFNN
jgi:hypothetical protein|tara:strand:- start:191 stop:1171 length:981 start_codon:yes stop_codon:yes gene_type:complete